MNNATYTFLCIILCGTFFNDMFSAEQAHNSGQIAHYAFKHAEQLLKNEDSYNPEDPFLNVLHYCPTTPARAYALACGDVGLSEGTMHLSTTEHTEYEKREKLKKYARCIVYLCVKKTENNHVYLAEHSECEKLVQNIGNIKINNQFCVVFNNPDNEAALHVMRVTQEKIQLFMQGNKETTQNVPEYALFLKDIITDSANRKQALSECMYTHYSPCVARAELSRLSWSFYIIKQWWSLCSLQTFSTMLQAYIVGMMCYKYFYW